MRLGRPRGRPSCPPAVGCEPRPPWVCPSERVLVRAGSPCRIPRTWPDEAGIGWRQPIERHQPTHISVKQRGTTGWRQLTKRWTSLVQYEPARTGVTALTDAHRRQPMDCCHLASTGVNRLTGVGWSVPTSNSVKRCQPMERRRPAYIGTNRRSGLKWRQPVEQPASAPAAVEHRSTRVPATGGRQRTDAPGHQRAGVSCRAR